MDSEFFQSATASLFLSGTFGAFTFVANNVPNAPVYPLAAPGVRIQFLPTSNSYLMSGVFGSDVNSAPATNNQNGTLFSLDGGSGMPGGVGGPVISSTNRRMTAGSKALIASARTCTPTITRPLPATAAERITASMECWTNSSTAAPTKPSASLCVAGGAPANTDFVDYYVDGGFNFAGFIPGRESDVIGVAAARSHVSDDFSDSQVAAGGLPSTAENRDRSDLQSAAGPVVERPTGPSVYRHPQRPGRFPTTRRFWGCEARWLSKAVWVPSNLPPSSI